MFCCHPVTALFACIEDIMFGLQRSPTSNDSLAGNPGGRGKRGGETPSPLFLAFTLMISMTVLPLFPRYLDFLLLMQVLIGSVLKTYKCFHYSFVKCGLVAAIVKLRCLYTRCSSAAVHTCKTVAKAFDSGTAV